MVAVHLCKAEMVLARFMCDCPQITSAQPPHALQGWGRGRLEAVSASEA